MINSKDEDVRKIKRILKKMEYFKDIGDLSPQDIEELKSLGYESQELRAAILEKEKGNLINKFTQNYQQGIGTNPDKIINDLLKSRNTTGGSSILNRPNSLTVVNWLDKAQIMATEKISMIDKIRNIVGNATRNDVPLFNIDLTEHVLADEAFAGLYNNAKNGLKGHPTDGRVLFKIIEDNVFKHDSGLKASTIGINTMGINTYLNGRLDPNKPVKRNHGIESRINKTLNQYSNLAKTENSIYLGINGHINDRIDQIFSDAVDLQNNSSALNQKEGTTTQIMGKMRRVLVGGQYKDMMVDVMGELRTPIDEDPIDRELRNQIDINDAELKKARSTIAGNSSKINNYKEVLHKLKNGEITWEKARELTQVNGIGPKDVEKKIKAAADELSLVKEQPTMMKRIHAQNKFLKEVSNGNVDILEADPENKGKFNKRSYKHTIVKNTAEKVSQGRGVGAYEYALHNNSTLIHPELGRVKVKGINRIDGAAVEAILSPTVINPKDISMSLHEVLKDRVNAKAFSDLSGLDAKEVHQQVRDRITRAESNVFDIMDEKINSVHSKDMLKDVLDDKWTTIKSYFGAGQVDKMKMQQGIIDTLFKRAPWALMNENNALAMEAAGNAFEEALLSTSIVNSNSIMGSTQQANIYKEVEEKFMGNFLNSYFGEDGATNGRRSNIIIDGLIDDYKNSPFTKQMSLDTFLKVSMDEINTSYNGKYKDFLSNVSQGDVHGYIGEKFGLMNLDQDYGFEYEKDSYGDPSGHKDPRPITTIDAEMRSRGSSQVHKAYLSNISAEVSPGVIQSISSNVMNSDEGRKRYGKLFEAFAGFESVDINLANKIVNSWVKDEIRAAEKLEGSMVGGDEVGLRATKSGIYDRANMMKKAFKSETSKAINNMSVVQKTKMLVNTMNGLAKSSQEKGRAFNVGTFWDELIDQFDLRQFGFKKNEISEVMNNIEEITGMSSRTFREDELRKQLEGGRSKNVKYKGEDYQIRLNQNYGHIELIDSRGQINVLGVISDKEKVYTGVLDSKAYTEAVQHTAPPAQMEIFNELAITKAETRGGKPLSGTAVGNIHSLRNIMNGSKFVGLDLETTGLLNTTNRNLLIPTSIYATKERLEKDAKGKFRRVQVDKALDIIIKPTKEVKDYIDKGLANYTEKDVVKISTEYQKHGIKYSKDQLTMLEDNFNSAKGEYKGKYGSDLDMSINNEKVNLENARRIATNKSIRAKNDIQNLLNKISIPHNVRKDPIYLEEIKYGNVAEGVELDYLNRIKIASERSHDRYNKAIGYKKTAIKRYGQEYAATRNEIRSITSIIGEVSVLQDLETKVDKARSLFNETAVYGDLAVQKRHTAYKQISKNKELVGILTSYAKFAPELQGEDKRTQKIFNKIAKFEYKPNSAKKLDNLISWARSGIRHIEQTGVEVSVGLNMLNKYMGKNILVGMNLADADIPVFIKGTLESQARLKRKEFIEENAHKRTLNREYGSKEAIARQTNKVRTLAEDLRVSRAAARTAKNSLNPIADLMFLHYLFNPNAGSKHSLEAQLRAAGIDTSVYKLHEAATDVNMTVDKLVHNLNNMKPDSEISKALANYRPLQEGDWLFKTSGRSTGGVTHGTYMYNGMVETKNGAQTNLVKYIGKDAAGKEILEDVVLKASNKTELIQNMGKMFSTIDNNEFEQRAQAYVSDRVRRDIQRASSSHTKYIGQYTNSLTKAGTSVEIKEAIDQLNVTRSKYAAILDSKGTIPASMSEVEHTLLSNSIKKMSSDPLKWIDKQVTKLSEAGNKRAGTTESQMVARHVIDWFKSSEGSAVKDGLVSGQVMKEMGPGYGFSSNQHKEFLRTMNNSLIERAKARTGAASTTPWLREMGMIDKTSSMIDISSHYTIQSSIQNALNTPTFSKNGNEYLDGFMSKGYSYAEANELTEHKMVSDLKGIMLKSNKGLKFSAKQQSVLGLTQDLVSQGDKFGTQIHMPDYTIVPGADDGSYVTNSIKQYTQDAYNTKLRGLPHQETIANRIAEKVGQLGSIAGGLTPFDASGIGVDLSGATTTGGLFNSKGELSNVGNMIQQLGDNNYRPMDKAAVREYSTEQFQKWAMGQGLTELNADGKYQTIQSKKSLFNRYETGFREELNGAISKIDEVNQVINKNTGEIWRDIVNAATSNNYDTEAGQQARNFLGWDNGEMNQEQMRNQMVTEGKYRGHRFGDIPHEEIQALGSKTLNVTDNAVVSEVSEKLWKNKQELAYRADRYLNTLVSPADHQYVEINPHTPPAQIIDNELDNIFSRFNTTIETETTVAQRVINTGSIRTNTVLEAIFPQAAPVATSTTEAVSHVNWSRPALIGAGVAAGLAGALVGGMRWSGQGNHEAAQQQKAMTGPNAGTRDFNAGKGVASSNSRSGKKVYAENGASINVHGKSRRSVDRDQLGANISNTINGSMEANVNINTRDDSSHITDQWLEDKFMKLLKG